MTSGLEAWIGGLPWPEMAVRTGEHLSLMARSVGIATALALPLGIALYRRPRAAGLATSVTGIFQTIPSLALLGFLLPVFGIGETPAVMALVLYALLPILRNTVVGLRGVDPDVVDAARGMGMSAAQRLMRIELPLALPTIFAGLRTAAVVNAGVTTLSALIGAGGLGVFIFRGIATNQPALILAGAVPAAALALGLDFILGWVQVRLLTKPRRVLLGLALAALAGAAAFWATGRAPGAAPLRMGFTAEFMERADGLAALVRHYDLPRPDARELDPGLLYDALARGQVDVACGFATDGRIPALGLRTLVDDRAFFPKYEPGFVVRHDALARHPGLGPLLAALTGLIPDAAMAELNRRIDQGGESPEAVAVDFLRQHAGRLGVGWSEDRLAEKQRAGAAGADLRIGTKNFTEQYFLGALAAALINGASPQRAHVTYGLGGSSLVWEAVRRGDLDLYPEYSGTLAATLLRQPPGTPVETLAAALERDHGLAFVGSPLGFNNTYVLLVRGDDPRFADVRTISELVRMMRSSP